MWSSVSDVVRLILILGVTLLLLRAARAAWSRRRLAVRIWMALRLRHLAGSLGLVILVVSTALALLTFLPPTRLGLGSLVGLDGNVVFAPIDGALEAPLDQAILAEQTGEEPAGIPWTDVVLVTGFLSALLAMFPHLAHAEEQTFRSGWENLTGWQQAVSALKFGLAHLIMLIPLAAAIAVAVAGFVYGRIYRQAYAAAAVPRMWHPSGRMPLMEDAAGYTRLVSGPPTPRMVVDVPAARQQAIFTAAVWHTAFNSTIVVMVLVGYLLSV